jgi:hypothetical protein
MFWYRYCINHDNTKKEDIMNTVIHNTMSIVSTVLSCVCVLGVIALVNYALSRDKIVTRTMRHQ